MPVVAERMNSAPKVVFSRTLDRADWNNTRLVKDDPVQARAYRVLLERLHNRVPRPDASLTPEQQQAADTLAATMYHDDFHDRPLPDSEIESAETATRNLLAMDTPDCR